MWFGMDSEQETNESIPASTWKIKPVRILTGAFETSLNAPGFSISLCNLSAASRETGTSVAELLELLDAPTTAVSWPNVTGPRQQNGVSQKAPQESTGSTKVADGVDIVGECSISPEPDHLKTHKWKADLFLLVQWTPNFSVPSSAQDVRQPSQRSQT